MTINDTIDTVLRGVKAEWTTLEKIRYVYLALGKTLHKHTDFFFSVDNKLSDRNMLIEEIKQIYEDKKDTGDLKVICRSAAYMLQKAYDRLGIKSELIKSNNNVINYENNGENVEINHWFLAVYDDEGKAYFLTLASDLPYIQMNMQTRHFASSIPYTKVQKNGEVIQVYCGKEIKHTVLDDEQLREIDEKIGYLRNQYHYDSDYQMTKKWFYNYDDAAIAMLVNELKNNKLYYDLECQSTRFYTKLMEFRNGDKEISFYGKETQSIEKEDWEVWIKKLCKFVHRKIEQIIGYKIYVDTYYNEENWNYKDWLYDICVQLQRYLYQFMNEDHPELYVTPDFNYSKWSRSMKKVIQDNYRVHEIDNVLAMLDKTNILASSVLGKPTDKFMKVFNMLAYHFMNRNYVFESDVNDKRITSKYIAHKFSRLFKRVFSCGEEKTEFNSMSYSEQIVILKMIVDKMFPEINIDNGILEEWYDDRYSVVQNRIQTYAIRSKSNDEYAVVFHVLGDETYDDTYYFYDPKENIFKVTNILNINDGYTIISNRLRTRIEDMEDIEEKKTKK